jgi:hypothetical protein
MPAPDVIFPASLEPRALFHRTPWQDVRDSPAPRLGGTYRIFLKYFGHWQQKFYSAGSMVKKITTGENQNDPMPNPLIRRRTTLNLLGILVLLLGIGGASIVYRTENNRGQSTNQETPKVQNGWQDSTLSPDDTKGSSRDLELLYGKVGALVIGFWTRCEEFFSHPATGGTVIGLISVVLAFICFLRANRAHR